MKRHLGPIESIMWRVGREAPFNLTVGNLMILDRLPATTTVSERLGQAAEDAPRLRWRPDDPTGTRIRPAWVEDAGFDPGQHLRTMTVASPGDQRQVLDLLALLECQPFATHRPPWDVTLIDGLEGGRAALYLRAHHVVSDGMGGMALTNLLLDDPRRAATPRAEQEAADPTPTTTSGGARRLGAVSVTVDMRNAVRPLAAGVTSALSVDPVAAAVNGLQRGLDVLHSVSRQVVLGLPFSSLPSSGSVNSHFEVVSVPGARTAALSLGGSRNDLVVAAAAAGLGLYLERLGAPCPVLRLATPTCRQRGDGAGGNSFAPLRIEIPTASAHPGPHFGVVASRLAQGRAEPALSLTAPLATALSCLPNRLLLPVVHAQMSSIDFIATALPGLRRARTVAGAVIEASYPFGPRLGSLMNVTAFGNEDRLDVGIALDPEAVAEPGVLLACVVEALRGFVPEVVASAQRPTESSAPPSGVHLVSS